MASNIRDKRKARKSTGTIKSNEEVYDSLGLDDAVAPDDNEIEIIQTKYVENKRTRPLVARKYSYEEMAVQHSEQNIPQQLGNYRQAMEFLAHITLSKNEDNDLKI